VRHHDGEDVVGEDGGIEDPDELFAAEGIQRQPVVRGAVPDDEISMDYLLHFGSVEDARCWARGFFRLYNQEHYQSGIGLMPPAVIHFGLGDERWVERQES